MEARIDSAICAIEKKKLDKAKKELATTWRILLKTKVVFLKMKNRQRRPLTLKERNLIMLLFLMFLIHASALSSPFDSPFSFDKPHFCPDLSSGEEPVSLVDRKDTGETTAPISFLQEDQISQPSDVFDFEKSSDSCLFKVGSLREHVDFWSNSIRASDFIINTIVGGYRIPFFDLPENFVIPIDHRQYLGFSWNLGSAVLPFGMSSAPYIFIN